MGHQTIMRLFAKWHIWLGWLVGLPMLMWTVTGLVMIWVPIEDVRGNHLRAELPEMRTEGLVLPDVPASVFEATTLAAIVPATPADPPPAPATVMVFRFSTESALTVVVPLALVWAWSPAWQVQ